MVSQCILGSSLAKQLSGPPLCGMMFSSWKRRRRTWGTHGLQWCARLEKRKKEGFFVWRDGNELTCCAESPFEPPSFFCSCDLRILKFVQCLTHKNVTEQKVPVSILSWSSKKIKRVVRSRLAAETSDMATSIGTAGLDENTVEPDDDSRFFFGRLRGCFEKATNVVGDRLQEFARCDSQGRSRSLVSGPTCD